MGEIHEQSVPTDHRLSILAAIAISCLPAFLSFPWARVPVHRDRLENTKSPRAATDEIRVERPPLAHNQVIKGFRGYSAISSRTTRFLPTQSNRPDSTAIGVSCFSMRSLFSPR